MICRGREVSDIVIGAAAMYTHARPFPLDVIHIAWVQPPVAPI